MKVPKWRRVGRQLMFALPTLCLATMGSAHARSEDWIDVGAADADDTLTPFDDRVVWVSRGGGGHSMQVLRPDLRRGHVRTTLPRGGVGATRPVRIWDRVVFTASDGATGSEPWAIEGESPAALIADVMPGPDSSNVLEFRKVGARVVFAGDDDPDPFEVYAKKSYFSSDGRGPGTTRLARMDSGSPAWDAGGRGVAVARFQRIGAEGVGAFVTNGTAAGTQMLYRDLSSFLEFVGGPELVWFSEGRYSFSDRVDSFIARHDIAGADGTSTTSLPGAFAADVAQQLVPFGDGIAFVAGNEVSGRELWVSDDTVRQVVDLRVGSLSSDVSGLTSLGRRVVFVADDGAGATVWGSDGLASGTEALLPSGGAGTPPVIVGAVGDVALVEFGTSAGAFQLWRTDGTRAGTFPVLGQLGASRLADRGGGVVSNGSLYFVAERPSGELDLWRTDGSIAGTRRVFSGSAASSGSIPRICLRTPRGVVFEVDDGVHGVELWREVSGGARMVADLSPGVGSSRCHEIVQLTTGAFVAIVDVATPAGPQTRIVAIHNGAYDAHRPGDRDRDGFSDAVEFALGSSPSDDDDTPIGYAVSRSLQGVSADVHSSFERRTRETVTSFRVVVADAGVSDLGENSVIIDAGGHVAAATFARDETTINRYGLLMERSIVGGVLTIGGEVRTRGRPPRVDRRRGRRLSLSVTIDGAMGRVSIPVRESRAGGRRTLLAR